MWSPFFYSSLNIMLLKIVVAVKALFIMVTPVVTQMCMDIDNLHHNCISVMNDLRLPENIWID